MTRKTLFLHVGHGKTGSSYIQSSLARSVDTLRAHGVCYPIAEAVRQKAANGLVTSGNIRPYPGDFDKTLTYAEGDTLLFSNEGLFRTLLPTTLGEIRNTFPDAQIKVLLYVRNPLGNAASSYQEFVKQGKTVFTFEEFLSRFQQPLKAVEFHKACVAEGLDITVVNFSNVRKTLLANFEDWLGLPPKSLEEPQNLSVNRSLSRAEIALQSALNKYVEDDRAGFIGRTLCNELPEIPGEKPTASLKDLSAFQRRMSALITEANAYFGHELYALEALEPYQRGSGAEEGFTFSGEQIDLIARLVAERLDPV